MANIFPDDDIVFLDTLQILDPTEGMEMQRKLLQTWFKLKPNLLADKVDQLNRVVRTLHFNWVNCEILYDSEIWSNGRMDYRDGKEVRSIDPIPNCLKFDFVVQAGTLSLSRLLLADSLHIRQRMIDLTKLSQLIDQIAISN